MINPYNSDYPNYWATNYVLNSFNGQASSQLSSIYNLAQWAQSINTWNKQQISTKINTLATFTNDANKLMQASRPLQPNYSGNVFNQRATTSSAPNAVTAQALSGATIAKYSVSITHVASAQQNVGAALTSTAVTGLPVGNYTFNLNVNNANHAVSFNVSAGDTEQVVLNNMVKAINAVGAGVTASTTSDINTGTSKLVISADNGGAGNSFTLGDVVGNAVSHTGAGTVSTASANASYSVNGVSYTSSNNNIHLDNGKVTMNLSAATSNVTVSVTADTKAVSDAINNFATAYNDLQTFANSNQQFISPQFTIDLSGAFRYQARALGTVGITQNPDQTLAVNQTVLNNALQNSLGSNQATFSSLGGLAVSVGLQAQQIVANPPGAFANNLPIMNNNYLSTYNYLGTINKGAILSSLLPSGQIVNLFG